MSRQKKGLTQYNGHRLLALVGRCTSCGSEALHVTDHGAFVYFGCDSCGSNATVLRVPTTKTIETLAQQIRIEMGLKLVERLRE